MLSLAKQICLTVFTLVVCAALSAAQTPSTLEARRKALSDLLAEQWEYRLRRYSHCSARRSLRALRRASRVEGVCAALKAAQTTRVKTVRQICFARESMRHLPQAQV